MRLWFDSTRNYQHGSEVLRRHYRLLTGQVSVRLRADPPIARMITARQLRPHRTKEPWLRRSCCVRRTLESAAACPADAGGFDPLRARQFAGCNSSAESRAWNAAAGGSIPPTQTICPCAAGPASTVLTSRRRVRFSAWAPDISVSLSQAKARASGARDRRFDSFHVDHCGRLVDWQNAWPTPRRRRFDSFSAYHSPRYASGEAPRLSSGRGSVRLRHAAPFAPAARLDEHLTTNQEDGGSSPLGSSTSRVTSRWIGHPPSKRVERRFDSCRDRQSRPAVRWTNTRLRTGRLQVRFLSGRPMRAGSPMAEAAHSKRARLRVRLSPRPPIMPM